MPILLRANAFKFPKDTHSFNWHRRCWFCWHYYYYYCCRRHRRRRRCCWNFYTLYLTPYTIQPAIHIYFKLNWKLNNNANAHFDYPNVRSNWRMPKIECETKLYTLCHTHTHSHRNISTNQVCSHIYVSPSSWNANGIGAARWLFEFQRTMYRICGYVCIENYTLKNEKWVYRRRI